MNEEKSIEYLNSLIGDIDKLTSEERKKRYQYLKGLLDGTIQGPLTFNPFIDMNWLTRFKNFDSLDFNLKRTRYEAYLDTITENNSFDKYGVHIYDTKRTYTHREILEMVDKVSSNLMKNGIGENSKIGVMLNGSIEEVVLFLAASKIGAVLKYIDTMKAPDSIKQNVKEVKLDCFAIDECFLGLEKYINEKGIKTYVTNSRIKPDDNYHINFDCLYDDTKIIDYVSPYQEDKITLEINSSGTTGETKTINHTDYSTNASVEKMLHTDYRINDGDALVKMIPSQIGLGLITSLYTGLLSGALVIVIGGLDKEKLVSDLCGAVKNYDTFKKEHNLPETSKISIFTAPAFVNALVFNDDVKDLSNVGTMLAAGSKIPEKELATLDSVKAEKNCFIPTCNGYGQNEMAGGVTLNHVNNNKNGSAGFPTYDSQIIIVDPKTHQLLGKNQEGLILEKSESLFKDYENLPEETKQSRIIINGTEWFNSCDLGLMDDDGYIFITGRTTRVVVREDVKIYLDKLEEIIREMPGIKDCAIIRTTFGGSIEEMAVFIQAYESEDIDQIKSIILNSDKLSKFGMPFESELYFVNEIPYKRTGKIHYGEVTQLYNEINNPKKKVK